MVEGPQQGRLKDRNYILSIQESDNNGEEVVPEAGGMCTQRFVASFHHERGEERTGV